VWRDRLDLEDAFLTGYGPLADLDRQDSLVRSRTSHDRGLCHPGTRCLHVVQEGCRADTRRSVSVGAGAPAACSMIPWAGDSRRG
jgi:hypothetical protein